MDDYKKVKEKRENLKALAAALILSEHCRSHESCDDCVFCMDEIRETQPCALLRSGAPQCWDLHVLRTMKEVTQ